MAFKMTKTEIKRVQELLGKIEAARDAVNSAVATFNDKVLELARPVDNAIADLNELRSEMYGIFEDIHNERSGEYDDRSERWQESDAASDAQTWLDEIEAHRDAYEEEVQMPDVTMEVDLSLVDDNLEAELPTG